MEKILNRRVMSSAAALAVFICGSAAADVVQTKERTYAVKYKDEAVERFKVVWTANLTTTVKEEVGSPVPYQGAVDFRRCSWTVSATVDRTVALATRQGPTVPLPSMSKPLKDDAKGAGGGDLVVKGAREETCKQATERREKDVGEAKTAILATFERLTAADLESIKKDAQAKPDVVSVTVQ
jgi:hypothetical protein